MKKFFKKNSGKKNLLVILTTWSRGKNLPDIVQSIVNQTYSDYTVFICDDCSPDNPEKIVEKIQKQHRNVDIRYFRNRTNVGEGLNIKFALTRAFEYDFKYMVNFQDDNIYLDNHFFEDAINSPEENPDAIYCAGLFQRWGMKTDLLNPPPDAPDQKIFKVNGIDFWNNWGLFNFHWTACIFRYENFLKYNLSNFQRKDCWNGDSLTLLRLALSGKVMIYNGVVMDLAYNQGEWTYGKRFKDPIDAFVKEQKYYELAADSAIKAGVSESIADEWLLGHRVGLMKQTVQRIGNDKKNFQRLSEIVGDYDKRLPVILMNELFSALSPLMTSISPPPPVEKEETE